MELIPPITEAEKERIAILRWKLSEDDKHRNHFSSQFYYGADNEEFDSDVKELKSLENKQVLNLGFLSLQFNQKSIEYHTIFCDYLIASDAPFERITEKVKQVNDLVKGQEELIKNYNELKARLQ